LGSRKRRGKRTPANAGKAKKSPNCEGGGKRFTRKQILEKKKRREKGNLPLRRQKNPQKKPQKTIWKMGRGKKRKRQNRNAWATRGENLEKNLGDKKKKRGKTARYKEE